MSTASASSFCAGRDAGSDQGISSVPLAHPRVLETTGEPQIGGPLQLARCQLSHDGAEW